MRSGSVATKTGDATLATVQTLPAVRPALRSEFKIRVSRPLLMSLAEMAALAGNVKLETMVAQIVESQIVDFRRRNIPINFLHIKGKSAAKVAVENKGHWKLSEKQKEEIRQLRAQGEMAPVLAKRFGVGPSAIRRCLKERPKGTRFSPEQVQRILYLRDSENVSISEIAKRFCVGRVTILSVFAEYDQHTHTPNSIQPSERRGRLLLGHLSLPGPGGGR